MRKHAACILAAGKGTRMHSPKPKVLQTLLGEPMLRYVTMALAPLFSGHIWAVIGHGADQVRAAFAGEDDMRFAVQEQQSGTAHAFMQALPQIEAAGYEYVLVINGDTPLVTSDVLESFVQAAHGADVAFATLTLPHIGAYGRIVRDAHGHIAAIVEAKDYSPAQHGPASNEVNTGLYYLRIAAIRALLPHITHNNKSGEYYITDIVALAVAEGHTVRGVECGNTPTLLGVNSPAELAEAENILRAQRVQHCLSEGVVLHAAESIYVGPRVRLAPGAEVFGPCEIYGQSSIAAGAQVQSHCVLIDADVATGAIVRNFSHIQKACVGQGAVVGPYARLRPGAVLEESAHVGNFVEMKKATLGKGAKANHLSYLGDTTVGAGANIGAGTITCNYDGVHKHETHIGAGAFIGSNASLVAPVTIGENALVGAGSVITKNVPAAHLAVARGRQCVTARRNKK